MVIHKVFGSDDEETFAQPTENYEPTVKPSVASVPMSGKNRFEPETPVLQKRLSRRGPSQKSVSSQIRSLERLLKNKGDTLPDAVRSQKLQQLTELRRLDGEKTRRHTERSIMKKYRMVRFFERRKLERNLYLIEQRGNRPEDMEAKRLIEKDLFYVQHFPKGQKYIALFPKEGHTDQSRAKVEAIRASIQRSLRPCVKEPSGAPARDCVIDDRGNDDAKEAIATDDFFLSDVQQ